MKKIILVSLVLKNFKGARDLTVPFGYATDAFGDNGTGKTTLFDGFTWLMFDKDSQNKKDFDIKTMDENGNVLHGLEHSVEGTLSVDGKQLVLRKVFSEKWTKKRGSATSEFTGHTTDYFINGVPVKAKEYKDCIDGLIDEHIFKLLTSPTYFNEQMDWKARRKILLEVCGDVTDAEVIGANKSLAKLPDILGNRSIEDHRKVIAARRSDINKELEKIPVRIDEAERSKPDTNGLNEASIQNEIEQLKFEIDGKESSIASIQSGGEVAAQEKRIREIESDLIHIKNRIQEGTLDAVSQQRNKVMELRSDVNRYTDDIQRTERLINSNDSTITARKNEADRLRGQWGQVNSEQLDPCLDENCPTCGQSLPEEQVKAAHDKAFANFNRQKSEHLERISAQGKVAMTDVKRLQEENEHLSSQLADLRRKLSTAQQEFDNASTDLERMKSEVKDPLSDPEYEVKKKELDAVQQKIVTLRASDQEEIQRVRSALVGLRDEVRTKEQQLAAFSQVKTLDARIEELKRQERQLAKEYERLEEELFLTEEFIRSKVTLLEEKINSKFKHARFKLFEQQINGGMAETCETLYKGVPYGSGLNNAARINVGLDIINTLSEHFGLTAPIFVDNAEAVTQLAETVGQVVALYVSEKDKTLRIESEKRVMEAV